MIKTLYFSSALEYYSKIFFYIRSQYVQAVEGMVKWYLNFVVNAVVKGAYGLRKTWKLKFLLGLAQAAF